MGFTEQSRWLQKQLIVYRNEYDQETGQFVKTVPNDITDYLIRLDIDKGDIEGIGDSGTDGVIPTMEFTLKSDYFNNFNPSIQNGVAKYTTEKIIGDGTDTYTMTTTNILPNTIRILSTNGTSQKWQDFTVSPTHEWGSLSNTWINTGATIGNTPLYVKYNRSTNQITFDTNISIGDEITLQFSYIDTTEPNKWNNYNGRYDPLLWERKRVTFKAGYGTPTYARTEIEGNDTNRYPISDTIIIPNTIKIRTMDTSPVNDLTPTQFIEAYYTDVIGFDYDTNEIILATTIPTGVYFQIQYSYLTDNTILQFDGYLGDYIKVDDIGQTVTCIARDLTRELDLATISDGDVRDYDINSTSDYLLIEDLAQNLCDDKLGVDVEEIIVDDIAGSGTSNFLVPPSFDIWQYTTLRGALNKLVSRIGWFVGYRYEPISQLNKLTIFEPDRTKTTSDIDLSWITDIEAQTLGISGTDIINKVTVYYLDRTENVKTRSSVTVSDNDSILAYGTRHITIEVEHTTLISNSTDATTLANGIIADYKDLLADVQLKLPLTLNYNDGTYDRPIELYNTIKVNYPLMFDEDKIFGIESIRHSFDFENNQYNTYFTGVAKLRGYKNRWKRMITKPGAYQPTTSNRLSEYKQIPKPTNLTVVESGVENPSYSPLGYAVISWSKPEGYFPAKYEILMRNSTDANYDKSQPLEANREQIRLIVPIGVEQKIKIRPVSVTGLGGDFSDELTISAVGDLNAPNIPSGLSLVGLDEGFQAEWTPNTENDLLGYKIYIKQDGAPTTTVYDTRKLTSSSKTVISGLKPNQYHVRISAYDTSGNESNLTTDQTVNVGRVYVIRTQAQFQEWIDSLPNTEPLTDNPTTYDRVVIFEKTNGEDYSTTSNVDIYIKKTKFELIGVGQVNIALNTGGYVPEFKFVVDTLTISNINFKQTTTGTGFNPISIFEYDNDNEGIISIEKSILFSNTSTLELGCFIIGDFKKKNITLNQNLFFRMSLFIQGDFSSNENSIKIDNNGFYGNTSNVDPQYRKVIRLVSGDGALKNIYIKENAFNDALFDFEGSNVYELKQCIIKGNTFQKTQTYGDYFINFDGQVSDDYEITNLIATNNVVLFETITTGTYYFIKNDNTDFHSGSLNNNVTYSNGTTFTWLKNADADLNQNDNQIK